MEGGRERAFADTEERQVDEEDETLREARQTFTNEAVIPAHTYRSL